MDTLNPSLICLRTIRGAFSSCSADRQMEGNHSGSIGPSNIEQHAIKHFTLTHLASLL